MKDQQRDQSQQGQQHDHKREAPGQGHDASDRAMQGEKPKTEQSSHQGGGGVRGDHRPQGK
jgi:hypothetical protein